MATPPVGTILPTSPVDDGPVDSDRESFPLLASVSPADDNPASAPLSDPSPLASPDLLAIPSGRFQHLSAPTSPAFPSPTRQHRRTPSQQRLIRETLDAVSNVGDDDDDGASHRRINQYTIKENIGHGSFGDVNLATDQYGKEYAVKQFSKCRMRKRARTLLMKQGPFRDGRFLGPTGPNPGAARFEREDQAERKDALHFIREEIAIMKKLNHPNLVALIEVLDDPEEDTLYMVMEMCKKGAIMDVDVQKTATPYDANTCRLFFRDLILGIEYLHAQNIVHRDIKPANLLVTDDDVLKIGDFGVSEIFEKPEVMRTRKSAGSPAFQPPELCVKNHGDVAGPPCDIWAMGVTLFCLRYGKLPFYAEGLDIYDAIKTNDVVLPNDEDESFAHLVHKLLEKDPAQRISMPAIRNHPWVTLDGTDTLLSTEENCAEPLEPPNALELSHAFTRNMGHLLCVMKAIGKFKGLLRSGSRHSSMAGHAFASETAYLKASKNKQPAQDAWATTMPIEDQVKLLLEERRKNSMKVASAADGRAPLIIGIGIGTGGGAGGADFELEHDQQQAAQDIVSESPTAADFDVYQSAFKLEVERIQSQSNPSTVYMNSFVERRGGSAQRDAGTATSSSTPTLMSVVAQAMRDANP